MFTNSTKKTHQNAGRDRPPSILASGLTVSGNVSSDGEIQIDGIVEGDVTCIRVSLGENAHVRGEIVAESVLIRGEVTGRIRAQAVELAKTARVRGDIWHSSLSIEPGAVLDGLCRHTDNPREAERALPAPSKKEAAASESSMSLDIPARPAGVAAL